MKRRVYVEKKQGFNIEARRLRIELADFLGNQFPELTEIKNLRILHRYDADTLDEEQFREISAAVFSEPQCDLVFFGDTVPAAKNETYFAVEYVPGQYDQRSDSAEQCAELVSGGGLEERTRPEIKTATVYIFETNGKPLSDEALDAIKKYLINPVDSREADAGAGPESSETTGETPPDIPGMKNFIHEDKTALEGHAKKYDLAMSLDDLLFCQSHFQSEGRDPTLTELKVLDTYWSDHCRHTSFNTIIEEIKFAADEGSSGLKKALELYEEARNEVYGGKKTEKKRTLMDIATIGAKVLKKRGLIPDVDESAEINAYTIKVKAEFKDRASEPWLLLFKNETHNHPTEIEPFGGAATCLGGAIRDPLSGRAFVHQAMRVTGGGDPRASSADTLPGKLPQLKIAREAAAGYSSYGNQIGLATGQVAEFYHPGFIAKRLELGAVIGAVPEDWVRREEPASGDLVILVGGRTGRDGIGGATGSSKTHTGESVETAGAEVQKGNAVEERKLQRLFRKKEVSALIKRCNDFGAGGVSVAVGELAAGLDINLDAVPKKYTGLDGTELAISESQERMAVVVSPSDAEEFIRRAGEENLEAVVIATVTSDSAGTGDDEARLRMFWRGKVIADLSRSFLNSNGAPRSTKILLNANSFSTEKKDLALPAGVLLDNLERELVSLRSGSRRGLQERFDGSIGAASVLFPWGGSEQGTPECGMAALLPSLEEQSRTASLLTFGYDPALALEDPYEGAKGSVREALAKFCCLGGNFRKARLSLQEYFERPESPESWGKPAAALLGALEAQLSLNIPAIGGKDSMSGTYRDSSRDINIAVPPTLVCFTAGTAPADKVVSGALSGKEGNFVILLGGDDWDNFTEGMDELENLMKKGAVRSAYPVPVGGVAAGLTLMAFGNLTGIEAYAASFHLINEKNYQGFVLAEVDEETAAKGENRITAARTLGEPVFRIIGEAEASDEDETPEPEPAAAEVPLEVLRRAYEYPLSQVYAQTSTGATAAENTADGTSPVIISDFLTQRHGGAEEEVSFPLPSGINGSGKASEEKSRQGGCQCDEPDCCVLRSPTDDAGRDSAHKILPIIKRPAGTYRLRPIKLPQDVFPLAVLPVFPGTNCEWDMERAFREAGARTRLVVFRNRNREDIKESLEEMKAAFDEAQIIAFSGGFSAGDEPDGSGKFIANVIRSPVIAEALTDFLENRDGLLLGICNGFQALIKTGLVPYRRIIPANEAMPTLSFNTIGRHVSRMVRTRVISCASPWMNLEEPGLIHIIPVSHGEGRVVIRPEEAEALFGAGQVPFCYCDSEGHPTMAEPDNPNGSAFAIEGLCSPDGRVLGKMGHSERCGDFVHINIPGNKKQRLFEAGVRYFT